MLVRHEDVVVTGEGVPARVESILYDGERYAVKLLLGERAGTSGLQPGALVGWRKRTGDAARRLASLMSKRLSEVGLSHY